MKPKLAVTISSNPYMLGEEYKLTCVLYKAEVTISQRNNGGWAAEGEVYQPNEDAGARLIKRVVDRFSVEGSTLKEVITASSDYLLKSSISLEEPLTLLASEQSHDPSESGSPSPD